MAAAANTRREAPAREHYQLPFPFSRSPRKRHSFRERKRGLIAAVAESLCLAYALWSCALCLMRAGIGKIFGDFPSLALQAWIGKLSTSKPEAQAKETRGVACTSTTRVERQELVQESNGARPRLRFGLRLRQRGLKT